MFSDVATVETSNDRHMVIYPLDLTDINQNLCAWPSQVHNEDVTGMPPQKDSPIFSIAMGMKSKRNIMTNKNEQNAKSTSLRWRTAAYRALHMADPWKEFHLEKLEVETATRYRYNALCKDWVVDEVTIKMAKEPFNHGAMRTCFRVKKLSNFAHENWEHASNYVAKCYMVNVNREVYFEDVKLQMDAKLWSEEYNRHNPPKKVDIFQMCVIELYNRPGKPLYHLEHYIEGKYIKYNSNSGFISSEGLRLTPQAFSHFTFERSGHELIVVDIQGVDDLYTDPQIHTSSGKEYGDGNLGTKGMALFFHSHVCNSICHSLNLSPFDLALPEKKANRKMAQLQRQCKTRVRGTEEICILPSEYERSHLTEFLRARTRTYSGSSSQGSPSDSEIFDSPLHSYIPGRRRDSGNRTISLSSDDMDEEYEERSEDEADDFTSLGISSDSGLGSLYISRRKRFDSESSATSTDEHQRVAFQELIARHSRPSCVYSEVQLRKMLDSDNNRMSEKSVLGQVHLEMAKYHELGRFSADGEEEYDHDAALFHMQHAADCGTVEAVITMAHIYLQLQHDLLIDISVPDTPENKEKGVEYMLQAAEGGDRAAIIYMAKSFDTGDNLGTSRKKSWKDAVHWYDKAVKLEKEEFDAYLDDPPYQLLFREADLYRQGGYGLEKDPNRAGELYHEAADVAMAAMKGRLANKFYMLAEEAWAEVEE
ncbi:eukaryotic elongation factor 2 kinase-like [Limulus polyphemus]|uniref:Eukaryotic elongation factor 2 kinase n=1 Tax=Limulus polyphemus TaxID=6850 RepID=A0ABM1T3M7_LIMPO|nr:eukaryotic elongation factor 2 kinase-like [Limulus polyphemus]XP_022250483.1 eukaryotic elongation factor 2 kinase-like [Limulus polyphemus]